jgi:hypothetical protein
MTHDGSSGHHIGPQLLPTIQSYKPSSLVCINQIHQFILTFDDHSLTITHRLHHFHLGDQGPQRLNAIPSYHCVLPTLEIIPISQFRVIRSSNMQLTTKVE